MLKYLLKGTHSSEKISEDPIFVILFLKFIFMEIVDLSPKPRVRENVEVLPAGEGKFILRDVAGYVDATLVLNDVSVLIISLLDGTKTEKEIVDIIRSSYNLQITEDEVKRLVSTLDENGFLDSPRFHSIKTEKKREYRTLPYRKAHLAGRSYPKGGREAEEFFSSILNLFPSDVEPQNGVIGVISPHIEIMNGMRVYGRVWSFLKNSFGVPPDTFVVFGTSHAFSPHSFILTDKSFETPFGTLENRKDVVEEIKNGLGESVFDDEILHKTEHSIEFQAIFIKFLFPSSKFIPILCTPTFASSSTGGRSRFEEEVGKLREIIENLMRQEKTVLVAGADLAHIGIRFGDGPVSQYDISVVRLKDIVSLRKFAENSADGFLESIMIDGNARRVCGLAPIYSLLKITQGMNLTGDMLGYDIWVDETASAVSFGGAFLSRKDKKEKGES